MGGERGDFARPDDAQHFSKRRVQIVTLAAGRVRRVEVDPGWRWSEHERPELHTASCELAHLGYVASGALAIAMDDGRRLDVTAGQVFDIPPGHDAWTLGDIPCVFIDFAAARRPAVGAVDG
jgi:quercetin dioxygenase-like cupin family protein